MSKILIVDDANLIRATIKKFLSDNSKYIVLEAKNGDEAIQLYKALKPDIITMDITMDIKNGVDTSREIMNLDPKAKIIMVTALGQEDLLKECLTIGAVDFIVKPFTKERIISAIEKALNR